MGTWPIALYLVFCSLTRRPENLAGLIQRALLCDWRPERQVVVRLLYGVHFKANNETTVSPSLNSHTSVLRSFWRLWSIFHTSGEVALVTDCHRISSNVYSLSPSLTLVTTLGRTYGTYLASFAAWYFYRRSYGPMSRRYPRTHQSS